MPEYAALVASPRALPDGLILVFQHPVKGFLSLESAKGADSGLRRTGRFKRNLVEKTGFKVHAHQAVSESTAPVQQELDNFHGLKAGDQAGGRCRNSEDGFGVFAGGFL